jgi:hypothetical protein
MALSKAAAHHRAKLANLCRDRQPDDPEIATARLNLRAEMLAAHVAEVVAKAPPLTAEQRDRIAAILRAGAA